MKKTKMLIFQKKIDGDKKGYIEIVKLNDKYHITFVYNYSKIETLCEEKNITEVILNSSYILSTIKFNDNIVELSLKDDYFTKKEEQYKVFKLKKENEHFISYSEEENER